MHLSSADPPACRCAGMDPMHAVHGALRGAAAAQPAVLAWCNSCQALLPAFSGAPCVYVSLPHFTCASICACSTRCRRGARVRGLPACWGWSAWKHPLPARGRHCGWAPLSGPTFGTKSSSQLVNKCTHVCASSCPPSARCCACYLAHRPTQRASGRDVRGPPDVRHRHVHWQ